MSCYKCTKVLYIGTILRYYYYFNNRGSNNYTNDCKLREKRLHRQTIKNMCFNTNLLGRYLLPIDINI